MGRRLQDKVALVTGAGSIGPGWGNGKAIAVLFAREGAKVFGVDRDLAAADQTRGIVEARAGSAPRTRPTSPGPGRSRAWSRRASAP